MELKELARERYSCRKFSDRKVPQALVDQIVEAGILAPTAVNKQPYRIFQMESQAAKEAIQQVTRYTFGADCFLVVGCKAEDAWVRPFDNCNFGTVDASIVATHMMLEITDLGLATTWVGYFDAPLLKKLCPQMADYELVAIFPIGYAADDAEPSPRHTQRNPMDEMLVKL